MIRAWNTAPDDVFSFVRGNENDKVFAVINFSAEPQSVTFSDAPFEGAYTEFFSGNPVDIDAEFEAALDPWGYKVYVQR